MITSVTLDDAVAAVVEQFRCRGRIGRGEAVNEPLGSGLRLKACRSRFQSRTRYLWLRLCVWNGAEALEPQEGSAAR